MHKIKATYFSEEAIPVKVRWINDPSINSQMFFDLPATVEKTKQWFESKIDTTNRVDFSFTRDGEYLAMGGFTNINQLAKHAEFYIMVNPKMHGKGIGSKVSYWMYNYAFITLNLNKIYLYTNNENIGAYKIYEKAGFKLEGVLREHKIKNNIFLDRRFYGLLRKEWSLQDWCTTNLVYELD